MRASLILGIVGRQDSGLESMASDPVDHAGELWDGECLKASSGVAFKQGGDAIKACFSERGPVHTGMAPPSNGGRQRERPLKHIYTRCIHAAFLFFVQGPV